MDKVNLDYPLINLSEQGELMRSWTIATLLKVCKFLTVLGLERLLAQDVLSHLNIFRRDLAVLF